MALFALAPSDCKRRPLVSYTDVVCRMNESCCWYRKRPNSTTLFKQENAPKHELHKAVREPFPISSLHLHHYHGFILSATVIMHRCRLGSQPFDSIMQDVTDKGPQLHVLSIFTTHWRIWKQPDRNIHRKIFSIRIIFQSAPRVHLASQWFSGFFS